MIKICQPKVKCDSASYRTLKKKKKKNCVGYRKVRVPENINEIELKFGCVAGSDTKQEKCYLVLWYGAKGAWFRSNYHLPSVEISFFYSPRGRGEKSLWAVWIIPYPWILITIFNLNPFIWHVNLLSTGLINYLYQSIPATKGLGLASKPTGIPRAGTSSHVSRVNDHHPRDQDEMIRTFSPNLTECVTRGSTLQLSNEMGETWIWMEMKYVKVREK